VRLRLFGFLAPLGLILVLFNACANNSSAPSAPVTVIQPVTILVTPTFTGTPPTLTLTFTPTPTGTIPTFTPTFTPTRTWTPQNTPAFDNNYPTSAAPNGFNYNGNVLTVAEGEGSGSTIVSMIETYNYVGSGTLAYQAAYNEAFQGVPTPNATPPWQGTPVVVTFPQALAVSGNYWALLDNQANGGATLWMADKGTWPTPDYGFGGPYGVNTNGFGGSPFNKPMAMAGDSLGNFYIADTGIGYIEMFGGAGCCGSPPWLHRWNGWGGANYIKPNTVACDANDNVWVGDAGYSPSRLQALSSGGSTLLGSWDLIPGCVINGLLVDLSIGGAATVYVSDSGNGGKVEVYLIQPYPNPYTPSTCNLIRTWGDPFSFHESHPFSPSCIALVGGGYILVGDIGNDLIQVFGP